MANVERTADRRERVFRSAVVIMGTLAALCAAEVSARVAPGEYSVNLVNSFPLDDPQSVSRDWFPCVGYIYMAVVGPQLPQEKGVMKTTWKSPSGKVLHAFDYHRQTATAGATAHWIGIRLRRGQGQLLLSLANQSVGMEKFIGTWTVTLSIHDDEVGKFNFDVIC